MSLLESRSKWDFRSPDARRPFTADTFYNWSNNNMYRTSYNDMSSKVNYISLSLLRPKSKRKVVLCLTIKDISQAKTQIMNSVEHSQRSLANVSTKLNSTISHSCFRLLVSIKVNYQGRTVLSLHLLTSTANALCNQLILALMIRTGPLLQETVGANLLSTTSQLQEGMGHKVKSSLIMVCLRVTDRRPQLLDLELE